MLMEMSLMSIQKTKMEMKLNNSFLSKRLSLRNVDNLSQLKLMDSSIRKEYSMLRLLRKMNRLRNVF